MLPSEVNDSLRGAAYKEFLTSPVGQDFLIRLVAIETTYQVNAFQATNHCEKATYTDKQAAFYQVRTLLDDLSKPVKAPASSTP